MNPRGNFHIKSNYIKAAKDNWVHCDVCITNDVSSSILCIKSLHGGSEANDHNFRPFTALCDLSEYKSCSVKTVSVNEQAPAKFALKLVPCGLMANKYLLIAMSNETEVTDWLAICKARIGKRNKNLQNLDDFSTLGTYRRDVSNSGDMHSINRGGSNQQLELDDNVLDNEVYEPYSTDDKIPATLEETCDFVKLNMTSNKCFLRLAEERVEVLDPVSNAPIHWFPYLFIRRFGSHKNELRIEAGRRCSTGEGVFQFRCSPPNGQPVASLVTQIRELALDAKRRTKAKQKQQLNTRSGGSCSDISYTRGSQLTIDRNMSDIRDTSFGSTSTMQLEPDTLPRTRSRSAKPPLSPPDQITRESGFSQMKAPRAVPDRSESQDAISEAGSGLANGVDRTIVKAKPARAISESRAMNESANMYDNLEVGGNRQRARLLPGAVNVLPLPVRSKPRDGSSNGLSATPPPQPPRSVQLDRRRPPGSQETSKTPSTPPPSASSPQFPESNNPTAKQHRSFSIGQDHSSNSPVSSTATPSQDLKSPMSSDQSSLANSSSSSIGSNKSDATPPTAPKPSATQINKARLRNDGQSTTLAQLLRSDSNTNSSSNGGGGNQTPSAANHTSRLNFQPSPGIASLIRRNFPDQVSQSQPTDYDRQPHQRQSTASIDSSPIDDSNNLIKDLDSVIEELYRESQAAAQFTREAAKKRQQMASQCYIPKGSLSNPGPPLATGNGGSHTNGLLTNGHNGNNTHRYNNGN